MSPEMKALVDDLAPILAKHHATIVVKAVPKRVATLAINTKTADHFLEFDEEIGLFELMNPGDGEFERTTPLAI